MNKIMREKFYDLLAFAKVNGLEEIAWQIKGKKIAFRINLGAVPAKAAKVDAKPSEEWAVTVIKSPIVGTFRRATTKSGSLSSPKGSQVKPGDKLAVVECMKIPTNVISQISGRLKEILVQDGQPVEFGQPLFKIELSKNGKN